MPRSQGSSFPIFHLTKACCYCVACPPSSCPSLRTFSPAPSVYTFPSRLLELFLLLSCYNGWRTSCPRSPHTAPHIYPKIRQEQLGSKGPRNIVWKTLVPPLLCVQKPSFLASLFWRMLYISLSSLSWFHKKGEPTFGPGRSWVQDTSRPDFRPWLCHFLAM